MPVIMFGPDGPIDPRRLWAEQSIAHYIDLLDDESSSLRNWILSHEQVDVVLHGFVDSEQLPEGPDDEPTDQFRRVAAAVMLGYMIGFTDCDMANRMIIRQDPDIPLESPGNHIFDKMHMPFKTEYEAPGGSGIGTGTYSAKGPDDE